MDYIVAALGNPGKEYAKTRHNAGWLALDYITDELNMTIRKLKFKSQYGENTVDEKKILFLKPQTFMNLSGESVYAAAEFYNIPAKHIIIICDDISLPTGKIRIRRSGTAGGHNGLKSIINMLDTDIFPRIRIGVSDRNNKNTDLAEWVLGIFSKDEMQLICDRFPDVYQAIKFIINGDIDLAMSKFN